MSREDPESIMVPPERLNGRPLGHIPHPYRLVLARRQDELMFRVEQGHRDIVEMTSAAIHFPSLGL